MKNRFLLCLALATIAPIATAQVALNQVDTFNDLQLAFWSGGSNPNVVNGGGPGGANDPYLQFTGSGAGGSGGVPAITNSLQWTGNYQVAGVKFVQMNLKNFSANPLIMRLMFIDDLGNRLTTTNANSFSLPANSGWMTARFRIDASGWVSVLGTSTWNYNSTHVVNCLLRNNAPNPTSSGTAAAATVGVDNITALDGITESPTSYAVTFGFAFGGSVASLQNSDNNRVTVFCDQGNSYGEVIIEGITTFLNPSIIDVTIESASTRTDISEFVELFNFSTGDYTTVTFRTLTQFDTTITGSVTTNAPFHIGAAGILRSKVAWFPQGDLVAADGWTQRIDMLRWKLRL